MFSSLQKCIVVITVFIITVRPSYAQGEKSDSLLSVLKTSAADTGKVTLLVTIASRYQHSDPAKGLSYALQALELAKSLKDNFGIANANSAVGTFYADKSDFKSSLEFYNRALAFLPKEKDLKSKKLYGRIQQSLGVIAYYQQDYATSVQFYLAAADIYKEIRDDGLLLVIYNNLSSVHAVMADKENALKYAEECYSLSKKVNDPFKTSMAGLAIASGKIELKKYEGVEKYLSESERLAIPLSNFVLLGRIYAGYGQLMAEYKKDGKKSITYFTKSLTNFEKAGSQVELAAAHQRLGEAYSREDNYSEADGELNRAISMSTQLGALQITAPALKSLSELKEKQHNTSAALLLLKQYNTINDTINLQDKQQQIGLLETKYETRIKEYKIIELQKEKLLQDLSIKQKSTFNYILLGSFLTLLLISFLSYRNYRQKQLLQQQQITQLQNEKLLLATESILKGQEDERTRMAQDLHDGLGGMLSGVKLTLGAMKGNVILSEESARLFTKAFEQLDSSIGEMRRVAHNMMPEALVKLGLQQALLDYCDGISQSQSMKINCEFHGLEQRLQNSTEIIVYRIIQELVNNIIKHANASTVLVQLMRNGNLLDITVEDNGAGFNKNDDSLKRGAGLNNIKSRVDYLNGQLDIQSTPGEGTSVHIECSI